MTGFRLGLAVAAVLVLGGAQAAAQPASDKVAAGERVAERSCGGCHAVAGGPSPLADAPPFRDLHRRYPAGGLRQILQEGMLQPTAPEEEGAPSRHPRMPMVGLGVDEVDELTAYLHSLEVASRRPPSVRP
jgi:mono/diheme cytochrome c family protein